jgi:ABC-2 type transport system permease protein
VFGLGRGALPKVLAFGLAFFAFIPAFIQLALGAIGAGDFEFVGPEEFFGTIQTILVLFVAAMSSDLIGSDRHNNTLVLYFSRPIRRDDYVLAKIGSLALALLALTLLPLLLTFVGNWLGASDGSGWFSDNVSDLFGITVGSILVCVQLASIAVVIASFSSRRAFAMISVLAVLLFSFIAASILAELLSRTWAGIVMLLSPLYVMRAVTLVLFDAVPRVGPDDFRDGPDDNIGYADLPGWLWLLALVVQVVLATWFAISRYRREI